MADEFDRFLKEALGVPEREPDFAFVSRVQSRAALEERFAAHRGAVIRDLLQQLVALLAVGASAWWLGSSAAVAGWAAESPATALAILLAAFMFVAGMFMTPTAGRNVLDGPS